MGLTTSGLFPIMASPTGAIENVAPFKKFTKFEKFGRLSPPVLTEGVRQVFERRSNGVNHANVLTLREFRRGVRVFESLSGETRGG